MKAKMSSFLENSKPILKKLVEILRKDFNYVSILGTDTFGTKYSINRNGADINDSMWNERGFVVRVHNGINYSEFSFNELNGEALDALVSKIKTTLTSQKNILKDSLTQNEYPLLQEDPIKRSFIGEVKIHPSEVNSKEKINRMQKMM